MPNILDKNTKIINKKVPCYFDINLLQLSLASVNLNYKLNRIDKIHQIRGN